MEVVKSASGSRNCGRKNRKHIRHYSNASVKLKKKQLRCVRLSFTHSVNIGLANRRRTYRWTHANSKMLSLRCSASLVIKLSKHHTLTTVAKTPLP